MGRDNTGKVGAQRWPLALTTLGAVEHRTSSVPARLVPTALEFRGRLARRAVGDLASLPTDLVQPWAQTPRRLRAPVGADAVRLGKFDVGRIVRLRSFYGAEGLSLRVQAGGRGRTDGVARILTAAEHVAQHCPELMPRIVDNGRVLRRRVAFLAEEMVDGRHRKGPRHVLDLLEPLVERLHRVHRGAGITHERLSAVVSPLFAHRWGELVASGAVDPALDPVVRRLRARRLPRGQPGPR